MAKIPALNKRQHLARLRELQRQGYCVRKVKMSNGDVIVLKSKEPKVCHAWKAGRRR